MYLTFDQVILVANKDKVDPEDPVIYVRELAGGGLLLALDDKPYPQVGEATRYGRLYYDAKERPCVVPDVWTWDDTHKCKDCIPPEDPLERMMP